MKNNTFNQVINANLASVDPASASSHSPSQRRSVQEGHQQVIQGLHRQASH